MREITLTVKKHTLRRYRRNFTKLHNVPNKPRFDRNIKYVFTCENESGKIGWLVGVETKQGTYGLFCFGRLCFEMTKAEMLAQLAMNF